MCACVCVFVGVCVCVCVCVCVYVCMYKMYIIYYIYTYIHTHTYTHTFMHTQTQQALCVSMSQDDLVLTDGHEEVGHMHVDLHHRQLQRRMGSQVPRRLALKSITHSRASHIQQHPAPKGITHSNEHQTLKRAAPTHLQGRMLSQVPIGLCAQDCANGHRFTVEKRC